MGNSYVLNLIISDNRGGWDDATIELDIVSQPNSNPVVPIDPYILKIERGETVTLPVKTSHGAYDPDGDTMTLQTQPYDMSLLTIDTSAANPGDLRADITADIAAPLGTFTSFTFKVRDDRVPNPSNRQL